MRMAFIQKKGFLPSPLLVAKQLKGLEGYC